MAMAKACMAGTPLAAVELTSGTGHEQRSVEALEIG